MGGLSLGCHRQGRVHFNKLAMHRRYFHLNFPLGLAMDDNKRAAVRQRVLKAGRIAFGGAGIDCVVRNISQTGAALEVESPLGIPHEFTLLVTADNSYRSCRVIWRKKKRIGVMFNQGHQ